MTEKQLPSTEFARRELSVQTFEDLQKMASMYVAAGMCEVTDKELAHGLTPEKKLAIASVKIMAGVEFGLTPFQAMSGLHAIKGKITPGYQTLLGLVRRHGYNYKVLRNTNDAAEIEWFDKDKKSLGTTIFDTKDMQIAGLGGTNWQKWKRRMLFSKCVTEGVNTHLADILGAPAYTPEDFDVVEGEAQEIEDPKPVTKAASGASKKTSKSETTAPSATSAKTKTESSSRSEASVTSATTAEEQTSTEIASGDAPSNPPPDVTDVDVIEPNPTAERPGEEAWQQLYALGIEGNLDEDTVQGIMASALTEQGISTNDGIEAVFANWTFETVEYIREQLQNAIG